LIQKSLLVSVAFSSNFIPRLIHDFSTELNKIDYLEFTLAYFDTKDFEGGLKPNATVEYDICRYPEFRTGPNHDTPYKRPDYYWKILAARLAFIIIFQNIVAWLQQFIDWLVPGNNFSFNVTLSYIFDNFMSR
jgi:anoctamin-1